MECILNYTLSLKYKMDFWEAFRFLQQKIDISLDYIFSGNKRKYPE